MEVGCASSEFFSSLTCDCRGVAFRLSVQWRRVETISTLNQLIVAVQKAGFHLLAQLRVGLHLGLRDRVLDLDQEFGERSSPDFLLRATFFNDMLNIQHVIVDAADPFFSVRKSVCSFLSCVNPQPQT